MSRPINDTLAVQSSLHRIGTRPDGAIEGVIQEGSWDPTTGTVLVTIGDTAALFDDSGDQGVTIKAELGTPGVGVQIAPYGGEDVKLFRTQSGWVAVPWHNTDNSPGAAKGDLWLCHRNTSKAVDAYVKLITGAVINIVGTLVQLGAINLDATNDAVITKRMLDAYGTAMMSTIRAWAKANFASGTNPSAPDFTSYITQSGSTAPTSTGSSKVKAAQ